MLRAVALLLTLLTGFSGLVYEVAWQKYLGTLLGSHSEATAAILGIFLGGLSLGYALFGRLTERWVARAAAQGRPPPLLFGYGVVEASIGVYALVFPWLFRGVQALSLALPRGSDGVAFAVDVGLTVLLIGPPSTLMGGTIPILTQALSRSLSDATRLHAYVYAFNTAGAFVGALAAGFVLVPWLGLDACVRLVGVINLVAGGIFLVLGLRRSESVGTPAIAPAAAPRETEAPAGFAIFAAVALLAGFAAMALQTTLIRLGGLALGASHFTFSMVVAVFVLCIALGSFVVSALPRIRPIHLVASQWVLVALLVLLYGQLEDVAYWAHWLRTLFRDVDSAFYPFYLSSFVAILAVLAIPVGISGATLPLLFHQLRREIGDLGSVAGKLYSWNTVGSLLGALLGGYTLLFWLDLDEVYRLAVAAVAVAGTLLAVRLLDLHRVVFPVAVLTPVLAGLMLLPGWAPERLATGLFRARQPTEATALGPDAFFAARATPTVLYYEDDPVTTTAVFDYPQTTPPLLTILTNGKPDGSVPVDYPTMGLAAVLPALFADDCERSFVIGFGTGVTVGELAALDCARDVTVAEISPGVLEAAPHFDPHNQGATLNPRIRMHRGDAYRSLLRAEGVYDVIASEPSNPWVTGVEMLFSREFLEAARDRLAPGGVYAQWFHTYETDTATVELVLRTYAAVFDQVAVWHALGPDLLLLGFRDATHALDVERLRRRASRPDFARALARCGIDHFPQLLAHELLPLGVVNAAEFDGGVHTLLHPVLSQRAARAFFRGGQAELPATVGPTARELGAERSLLRRFARRSGGGLTDAQRAMVVRETCKHRQFECVTQLAAWRHADPESAHFARVFNEVRPRIAGFLKPGLMRELTALFGGRTGTRPVRSDDAEKVSRLFERFYVHAAPFDARTLAAVWARCRDGQGGRRCAALRAGVEARVGPLPAAAVSRRAGEPLGG